jgi:hypothetical protein
MAPPEDLFLRQLSTGPLRARPWKSAKSPVAPGHTREGEGSTQTLTFDSTTSGPAISVGQWSRQSVGDDASPTLPFRSTRAEAWRRTL